MKKLSITLIVTILLSIFIIGCNADKPNNQKYNTVSVCLETNNQTSKSLSTSLTNFEKDNYYWRYTAVKNDAGSKIGEKTSETNVKTSGTGLGNLDGEFATGKWTFCLFAYEDQTFTKKMFSGSTAVTITGTEPTVTVTITVGPLNAATGNLRIEKLNPKSGYPTNTNQVAYIKGSTTDTSFTDFPTTITDLASGSYTVTIELSYTDGDDTFKTASEPIQVTIYDYLTTTISGNVDDLTSHVNIDSDGSLVISFNTSGGSVVGSQLVSKGGKVTSPADPVKVNHLFEGWYEDSSYTTLCDFNTLTFTTDTVLYAKWFSCLYLEPIYNSATDASLGIKSWTEKNISTINYSFMNSDSTNLSSGWYIAKGSITINSRITCNGNVHLILADGCNLNATHGISVTGDNSLTIYAQSTTDTDTSKMGILTATAGSSDGAGIGGTKSSSSKNANNITINGGKINASSTGNSAGIGGGYEGYSGGGNANNIVINGGCIQATVNRDSDNSDYCGAGIGAGSGGRRNSPIASNILINGGSIVARGCGKSAGIGSGDDGMVENIIINGGSIEASGGSKSNGNSGGAGIGTGGKTDRTITATNIKINGGSVTTYGGPYSAGIGAGDGAGVDCIKISGGIINTNGGSYGSGIGGGKFIYNIVITGGNITAYGGTSGIGKGNTYLGFVSTGISVSSDLTVKAGNSSNPSSVIASDRNSSDDIASYLNSKKYCTIRPSN